MDRISFEAIIEELLEKPYQVIDILPVQVPDSPDGQYFAVEQFFLQDHERKAIYQKFARLLLKLNCYHDLVVDGEMDPPPDTLFSKIVETGPTGYHIILLPKENALIALNGGDLYMTIYNASETLTGLIEPLAASEGLFVR